jgi:hypothetical protein
MSDTTKLKLWIRFVYSRLNEIHDCSGVDEYPKCAHLSDWAEEQIIVQESILDRANILTELAMTLAEHAPGSAEEHDMKICIKTLMYVVWNLTRPYVDHPDAPKDGPQDII